MASAKVSARSYHADSTACPHGCKDCRIPDFSAVATMDKLVCTSCQDGFVMRNRTCVADCGKGWYLSADSNTCMGGLDICEELTDCAACDPKCKTCAGKADFCLACGSGLAHNGTCIAECPSNTFATNGTCASCSLDCSTCSGSSASDCVSCPPTRPLLQDGRCLPYCPQGTYAADSKCKPCDKSCATCTAGSSCTSCGRGQVLKAGACVGVTCLFANTFGICLSGFIDKPANSTSATPPSPSAAAQFKSQTSGPTLAPLAALAILPLLILLAWYIRRQRRKTRERTAEFASQLDNREVGKRLDVLAAEEELESKKRRGLKDLWLKHKARVARPRSLEEGVLGHDGSTPRQAPGKPESVRMQDFSKRSSFDEIGQDPSPLEPARAFRSDVTSATTPFYAPSTNPPEAPKASLDLTHLWPNLASRPNAQ